MRSFDGFSGLPCRKDAGYYVAFPNGSIRLSHADLIRPLLLPEVAMSRYASVLITGASGEIGHGLIARLTTEEPARPVITLDLNPLPGEFANKVRHQFTGSILDPQLLERIIAEYEVDRVFHLAALLSTRSEFSPALAHKVNVEGTLNMLEFAQKEGESHGRPVVFFYPSSIAAFGIPTLAAKTAAGRV